MAKSHNKQRVNFFAKQASWVFLSAIMFLGGYMTATYATDEKDKQISMLAQSSANLAAENQTLIERYNQQKIELDISQISLNDTKQMLEQSIKREYELERQVTLYQRVMSPKVDKDGFFVEHAQVTHMQADNAYRLSLVLLQNRKFKDTLSGKLNIRLLGLRDGKLASYSLSGISDASQSFDYAFKYFQQKDIPFVLPPSFIPDRVEITTDIFRLKRKHASFSKTLKWQDIMANSDNT
ncbi:MAG: DUF6776 family protein [Pseudomonadota bacterium]